MVRCRSTWVVIAALAILSCERGCARHQSAPSPESPAPRPFDLAGTDCPGGLVRCVDGRVEASRPGHVPHPCTGTACECPWEIVGSCAKGCIADGLELVAEADAGAATCRPDAPVTRPVLPGDAIAASVCSEESTRCAEGAVVVCDGPGRPARTIAVCLNGCEMAVSTPPGAPPIGDGAAGILCRRTPAERR